MIETINALKAAGHRFHRPTQYQLKVGAWNFYPTTGRVIREDSALAENERGLEAFLNLLALDQPKWKTRA
ncbi:hypothetical protein ACFQ4O_01890 [Methylopila musalis]|uniref:Uncharacterized protein n=1 Tax=Methylopila musalis TaxID=1134781 RepID=A0ABW3Z3I3_9HYPH